MRVTILVCYILAIIAIKFVFAEHQKYIEKGNAQINEKVEILNVGNVELQIVNNGRTGNFANAFYPKGTMLNFLFDGGIAVSGYINNELHVSWIATDALAWEWQPGKWGMSPDDSLAKFYVVTQSDGFGSQAYLNWADAVSLGAGFQDFNSDGMYDPFIDKPDILGDQTIWTVYNDGTADSVRQLGFSTPPMGLEVHQSVWAFASSSPLADIVFFRYRLINADTNTVDNLIFSLVTDADNGYAADDLTGSNPELQLGYNYNDGDDLDYGLNPPAFGLQLLQGAIVDSPGDTALHFRGPFFGTDTLLNKANLLMTSFMPYEKNPIPPLSIPEDSLQARFAQMGGLDKFGNPIDPTTWGNGGSVSDDPRFAFSGDPLSGSGWLDANPRDRRQMISSGPFHLAAGDTQDIIFAYVLGQGTDALESITAMRENAQAALAYIGNPLVLGVSNNNSPIASGFVLDQNYPNPFNAFTTIRYYLPRPTVVRLIIYDLWGRELWTLVQQMQTAGEHTVQWNGKDNFGQVVGTGIYFYSIHAGGYASTKKLLLLK